MILTFDLNADALMAHLRAYPERVARSVVRAMERSTILVQAQAKSNKLSGQVLHVRTGTLRRSINREVRASGTTIEGIVGTNVEYGAAHEYGFKGTVTVREHMRRITTNSKAKALGKMPKYGGYERKRRYFSGSTPVHSHTRTVNLPERSFLRSALKDMQPAIGLQFQRALIEAWKP